LSRIETYPFTRALAEAAAFAIEQQLRQGLKTRGRASLVATGGRSPGPVYDALHKARIDWSRVVVTLSDERCVEPTAPESNQRLLRERLLTGEPHKAHFIPLWPLPDEAALTALAPFDAVMLGMGEDGHIASLLPRAPNLAEGMDPTSGRLTFTVPEGVGNPPVARTSLTLPALLQARAIFILIAGDAKREIIAQADAGADYPVRALLAQDQVPVRVLWSPTH
jgi:6-phosphogluconolactonase